MQSIKLPLVELKNEGGKQDLGFHEFVYIPLHGDKIILHDFKAGIGADIFEVLFVEHNPLPSKPMATIYVKCLGDYNTYRYKII